MDVDDDKKNLYEVNELQDYDEIGKFATQPPVKTNEQGLNIKLAAFCLVGIMAVMFIMLIIVLGVTVVIMTRLDALKDDIYQSNTDQQQGVNNQNVTDVLLQTTGDSAQKLINIVNTLSALTDTSTSTAGVIDDILLVVAQLLELQNGSSLFNSITPVSCKDIKTTLPSSPSGWYHVNARNVYCNMDTLCGSGGGWTRLAYLSMNDSIDNCPSGFRTRLAGGVRACGRPAGGASCASVQFPSNGISYSQVCGRVVGYQFGTTDAIDFILGSNHNNLNSWYVDGVSITRGSPRQHVWTLMAGFSETSNTTRACPCSSQYPGSVQSFIGSNYFCESGNPNPNTGYRFYTSDLLWDGQNCGSREAACCSAPGLPWFYRDYGNTTTTDFLELRLCGDQPTSLEDAPINYYEIYVK